MNWAKYWFAVFILELFIWSYIIFLHFEIKDLKRIPKPIRFKMTRTITEEKTAREIVSG